MVMRVVTLQGWVRGYVGNRRGVVYASLVDDGHSNLKPREQLAGLGVTTGDEDLHCWQHLQ